MENRNGTTTASTSKTPAHDRFDFDALLHPARAFAHPMDVVRDADLTLNEKRAILASWASDACALEAAPDLRMTASGRVVRWDDIMDALRTLDREAGGHRKILPHYKRVLAKRRAGQLGMKQRQHDPGDQGRMVG